MSVCGELEGRGVLRLLRAMVTCDHLRDQQGLSHTTTIADASAGEAHSRLHLDRQAQLARILSFLTASML